MGIVDTLTSLIMFYSKHPISPCYRIGISKNRVINTFAFVLLASSVLPLNANYIAALAPLLLFQWSINKFLLCALILIMPLLAIVALQNPSALLYLAVIYYILSSRKAVFPQLTQTQWAVVLIAIVFQLAYSQITSVAGKPTLFGKEQNFSAAAILVLVLMTMSYSRFVPSAIGVLTLSRMYLLSLFVREFLQGILNVWKLSKGVYFSGLMFIVLAVISVHFWLMSGAEIQGYSHGFDRLFIISDTSALLRAERNISFITSLNISSLLFGIPVEEYSRQSQEHRIVAHNSLLQLMALYGLPLTLIYLFSLFVIFSRTEPLRICFLVLFFASMFLHSILSPANILLLYLYVSWRPHGGKAISILSPGHHRLNERHLIKRQGPYRLGRNKHLGGA